MANAVTRVQQNVVIKYGYTPEQAKELGLFNYSLPEEDRKGFRERERYNEESGDVELTKANEGQIGINISNTGGKGTEEYYNTVEHEGAHSVGAHLGMSKSDSESFATSMENMDAMSGGLWMSGAGGINYSNTNAKNTSSNINKELDMLSASLNNYKATLIYNDYKEDATVYIWNKGPTPTGNSAFGHAAIMTDDGNYLSHYPEKKEIGINYFKSKFYIPSEDIKEYGRPADFVFYKKLPDEEAASKKINKIKIEKKYWLPLNNCVSGTEDVLNAGDVANFNVLIDLPENLKKKIKKE